MLKKLRMLVTVRTARFLLLIFVILTACLVQGGDSYAAGEFNLVISEKKATQTTGEKRIVRREMVSDRDFLKMEMVKENGVIAKYTRKSRMLITRENNYEDRFVAFNADYRGPRHHPPKNN